MKQEREEREEAIAIHHLYNYLPGAGSPSDSQSMMKGSPDGGC